MRSGSAGRSPDDLPRRNFGREIQTSSAAWQRLNLASFAKSGLISRRSRRQRRYSRQYYRRSQTRSCGIRLTWQPGKSHTPTKYSDFVPGISHRTAGAGRHFFSSISDNISSVTCDFGIYWRQLS